MKLINHYIMLYPCHECYCRPPKDITSDVGLELAPLMKQQLTGKPKKDPATGYMLDAKLQSSDITKHASLQVVEEHVAGFDPDGVAGQPAVAQRG